MSVKLVENAGPITEGDAGLATTLREGLYRRSLAISDATAAALVGLIVLPAVAGGVVTPLALALVPLMVLLNKSVGLYERDEVVLKKTTLDEAPRLVQMAAVSTLMLWLLVDGATVIELDATDILVVWVSAFGLLTLGRVLARWIAGRLAMTERCLVIGEHASIEAVKLKLTHSRVNALVVASLDADLRNVATRRELMDTFAEVIRRYDVHRVIIAPSSAASTETIDLIRVAKHAGVRVSVVPRILEVVGSSVEFDHLDGLTMLGVRRFGLSRSSYLLKRAFDVFGASLVLTAVGPLMFAIMLAIKIDDRGPLFFRQTRVGKDGRRFLMLKFRSMIVDAEERKCDLRHLNESDGLFKIENDPRITRVGRFLRRTSLDELPQLLNVWRGEMSLVGPRPLVVDEDEQVQGLDRYRLHLTPGMTGHWQILGSARIPMHEMVGIDYLYVANWSLWTDVKILLRTIPYVFASRGM